MPDTIREPITLPPVDYPDTARDRDMEAFIRLLGRLTAERWRKISTSLPDQLPALPVSPPRK